MENKIALFWHRRDLRINDNHGLFKALTSGHKVIPIFIFDTTILSKLKAEDQRVIFIYQQIAKLKSEYQSFGSDLIVYYGNPVELIAQISKTFSTQKVFTNRDYEPLAIERDTEIFEKLQPLSIEFIGSKDHVIFEKNEVVKDDGKPYTVFTPFSSKWKATLTSQHLASFETLNHVSNLQAFDHKTPLITLNEMGFDGIETVDFPKNTVQEQIIEKYSEQRDFPAINGTSRLGLHLRFGTISIRELATYAKNTNETYLNELIWRDFYQMIIYHFHNSEEN